MRSAGAGLVSVALVASALVGQASSAAVTAKATSTLKVAFQAGSVPTSVLPFETGEQCTAANQDFWDLTTRPGFWFGLGSGVSYVPALSPLTTPTYQVVGANTEVEFSTKGWMWSNGSGGNATMDAADVAFWINLDKAQTDAGTNAACGREKGLGLPDQVVSVSYPDGLTGSKVQIVFQGHPSDDWLLYSQLSQIVPLAPAWDTTGSGAAGCATEPFASVSVTGSDPCSTVFKYLSNLAMSDPLWEWADGPYRDLSAPPGSSFVQVANTDYSGPVKAQAATKIEYKAFSNIRTEIAALQEGTLDFGYVLPSDVTKAPGPGKAGRNTLPRMSHYKVVGAPTYGVSFWFVNYDNQSSNSQTQGARPAWAEELNNLYFRVAIEESINQPKVIAQAYNGYAVQTSSAIPALPKGAFGTGVKNPYPYSANAGSKLLAANGWNTSVFPAVCERSGVDGCGSASNPIAKGDQAIIQLTPPLGTPAVSKQIKVEVAEIKAAADIEIQPQPFSYGGLINVCGAGGQMWQLCGYGAWGYSPDYYPSGEALFALRSYANQGGFDDTTMQSLIGATTANGSLALNGVDPTARTSYAAYTATELPFIWQPTPTSFIEQAKSIVGAQPPSPLTNFNPEYITAI